MISNNQSTQSMSNNVKLQDYSLNIQAQPLSTNTINNNNNTHGKNILRYPERHNRYNNESYSLDNNNNNNNNTNNFKVVIRVRPFLPREIENNKAISTVQIVNDNKMIQVIEYYSYDFPEAMTTKDILENTNKYTIHSFTFDHVFNEEVTQTEVYEYTAKPAVQSTLMGYNATILAYGQTGTGKTHTMEGFKYNGRDPQRGIIPRCMEEIFKHIENISNAKTTFMVRASYLQIYNDNISDLLRTERTGLSIREDKKKGLYVEGLSEWAVRTPSEIYSLIQKGASSRATASTKMNDVSSRSHAVFLIIVEQMMSSEDDGNHDSPLQIRVGKLNLVDLAGSERVRVTGATGQRLEECKKINQSLSALGNVISALADQRQPKAHIPYRDSKITRLLEDSLGGNCITTMMAMVSPSLDAFSETLSSIKFANRAKNIKNAPVINEDVDQKALLRKYEAELKRLKSELQEKNKILIDKKKLYELEEEKKKAEMHKVAAVAALEERSREFMEEREEKKKLEEKIRSMNSQLLVGGRKIEDTPQFRNALAEQQKLIRQQYEKRLLDLEKERTQIEEDKAQVDRYKQLLLKQRDIMIALTNRLNERDETIIQLQEEIDAYDRIHHESEENLEFQKAKTDKLEQILKENNLLLPNDQEILSLMNKKLLNKNYNNDIVTYDGEETYNITKSNLVDAEERINELTKLSASQKQEIQKLKKELEAHKSTNIDNSDFMSNEVNILQEQLKIAEENASNRLKIIQKKDEEIKNLKSLTNINNMNGVIQTSYQNQNEIKESIDHIIECLSGQNEPEQLQEVARKLLNLQKLVNITINTTTNNGSTENNNGLNSNNYPNIILENEFNKLMNNNSFKSKPSNDVGLKQNNEKQFLTKDSNVNTLHNSIKPNIIPQPSSIPPQNTIGVLKPLTSNLTEGTLNPNNEPNIGSISFLNKEKLIDNTNTQGQSNSRPLKSEIAKLLASRNNQNNNNAINENESLTPIQGGLSTYYKMNNNVVDSNIAPINQNNNNNAYDINYSIKDKNRKIDIDTLIKNDSKKRVPLTVEEMLKQKREEANKK